MSTAGKSAGLTIKQVVNSAFIIGEGPHWEEDKQCLTFVDIKGKSLHRYFTATGRCQQLKVEPGTSGHIVAYVMPVENHDQDNQDQDLFADLYVIGHGRSVSLIEWPVSDPDTHTRKIKVELAVVDDHSPTNRFNDAKCDPRGRLWAGTMSLDTSPTGVEKGKGKLYCLDSNLTLTTALDKVSLSNGLAWSADRRTLYYIDSYLYTVDAFDYDDQSGRIDNRRCILDFKKAGLEPDIPDGMCLDNDGNLWVACYMGAKMICIDTTTHKIIRKVGLPATNITSVCFGGRNYDTLYVTNASQHLTSEQISAEGALGLLEVTGLGVSGPPPVGFKIKPAALKKVLGKA